MELMEKTRDKRSQEGKKGIRNKRSQEGKKGIKNKRSQEGKMKTKTRNRSSPRLRDMSWKSPRADGKNGYYLSKPSVMITHNGAYGTTVYELKHGEDTLVTGENKIT